MLTPEMKQCSQQVYQKNLAWYEQEGNDFLSQIITGEESRVHHYDPKKIKHQSIVYKNKNSPTLQKMQSHYLSGKNDDYLLCLTKE